MRLPRMFVLLVALAIPVVASGSRALERSPRDRLDALFDEALARADHAVTHRAIDRDVGARGELVVSDHASGVALLATLEGGAGTRRNDERGTLFEGALGAGTRRLVVESGRGLEDWVGFERAPAQESLRYRVETRGATGLRFVARTLELLDASGAPRVRMAPPWLLDAGGERVELDVRVTGCAFDADVRAPFGRAVVAPGRACDVELSWAGRDVAYPIVVDPTWSATDSLATARREMAIGVLSDGTVLVAAGMVGALTTVNATASAEIFDPASETFAAAMDMPEARAHPYFATLDDGRLLVGGGARSGGTPTVVAGAIAYSATTAMWQALAPPATARVWAEAVVLPSGRVLVVGGKPDGYFGSGASLASAEVYDPVANAWSPAGSMATARYGNFVLARLNDGRVLAAGGWSGLSTTHATAEIYDPGTNAWTPTGSLAIGRGTGLFGTLPTGEVVVAGGTTNVAGTLVNTATTEVYEPALGTWSSAGPIGAPVDYRTNGALAWPDGTLVAPAGIGARGLYSERFVPVTRTWETGCDPTRTYLVAVGSVRLDDGRALVVGGIDGTGVVASAWLSGPEGGACDDGNPCTDDACNVASGGCTSTPNVLACDDGDACTAPDVCAAGACGGAIVAGCGDAGTPDSGTPDSGVGEDAAVEVDAGVDAAIVIDAAAAVDAGESRDAGGRLDAGRDAGSGLDASGSLVATDGGCGCRARGRSTGGGPVALALVAFGVWSRRRRPGPLDLRQAFRADR